MTRHTIDRGAARACRFCGGQPDMECVPPRAPGDDDTYFVLSHNCAAENYREECEHPADLLWYWNATQQYGQTLWLVGWLPIAVAVLVGFAAGWFA